MITYQVFKRYYKILALSKTNCFQIAYIYKKKKSIINVYKLIMKSSLSYYCHLFIVMSNLTYLSKIVEEAIVANKSLRI